MLWTRCRKITPSPETFKIKHKTGTDQMSDTFALSAGRKNLAREDASPTKLSATSLSHGSKVAVWLARIAIVALDLTSVVVAFGVAVWFTARLGARLPDLALAPILCSAGFVMLVALWRYGAFRFAPRHVGIPELMSILYAVSLGAVVAFAMCLLFGAGLGEAMLFAALDELFSAFFLVASNFSLRVYRSERTRRAKSANLKTVVIVGAGDGGASIARQFLSDPESFVRPVAFVDDDPIKAGTRICGVPVLGRIGQLAGVVASTQATEIVICIPSASPTQMSRIISECRHSDVPVRTLPTLRELIDGDVSIQNLQSIRIEDVLQRDRVNPDPCLLGTLLTGKTVLVTGAGGSIGSELCIQIAAAKPARLILVEKSENSLFYSQLNITEKSPEVETVPCLIDVTDADQLRAVFERERPNVVFHAAAYKHVGMMELHPHAAIRNNVIGTKNVAMLCLEFGAERFVNISTDKSVNPRCYMGLSKKIAEQIVKRIGQRHQVRFLNVRFGNVAGSTGSVLRLFKDQIKKGGPIRVTDPRATRFFMSIPEAVYLILCAAARGKNGETYIFDMGEPINIYQLARTMVLLSGYTPEQELPIEFIGLREGEKIHEELWEPWEKPRRTENPLLLVIEGRNPAPIDVDDCIHDMEHFLDCRDYGGLTSYIDREFPDFAALHVVSSPLIRADRSRTNAPQVHA